VEMCCVHSPTHLETDLANRLIGLSSYANVLCYTNLNRKIFLTLFDTYTINDFIKFVIVI
jgi:hypothetical protein